MSERYILAIDQSTSGTKALLFAQTGKLIGRADRPHRQIVNEQGWVEHDPEEILRNSLAVVQDVVAKTGIDKSAITALGISNQRETALAWDASTGKPVYNAIVWQCARGAAICNRIETAGHSEEVRAATGLHLSPYFSAAKLAWILENVPAAQTAAAQGNLRCGNIDSWLVYNLTGGQSFKTDYSNASRTQLFNLKDLQWDADVCGLFGLQTSLLPEVCDSNSLFGETDLAGYLARPIPIHGVLGDSHGALFGQGCLEPGMIKTTYGTGSSVMMNIGRKPIFAKSGVVTSIAWGMDGVVNYVLEGNINYTGAVMKWIVDDLGLISSAKDAAAVAANANPNDETYLVPAFSGLGAPYWESNAKAVICNMTRNTGKAEIVRAASECIAYQIADIINMMSGESGVTLKELRVDGGPTRDSYLMQFQSDILDMSVQVPDTEEQSGVGAAYAAGIATGVFSREIFTTISRQAYYPVMTPENRAKRYTGWKKSVEMVLNRAKA
ncbi:MAG: glycerol kinase GlpK [Firmicutes bacterium]|nr:glycerol kinase GlpK [Bacillota bacterium]